MSGYAPGGMNTLSSCDQFVGWCGFGVGFGPAFVAGAPRSGHAALAGRCAGSSHPPSHSTLKRTPRRSAPTGLRVPAGRTLRGRPRRQRSSGGRYAPSPTARAPRVAPDAPPAPCVVFTADCSTERGGGKCYSSDSRALVSSSSRTPSWWRTRGHSVDRASVTRTAYGSASRAVTSSGVNQLTSVASSLSVA